MKKIFFLISVLALAFNSFAQTVPAGYTIALNKFRKFYNNNQPDSIYKMFGPEMTSSITADQFNTTHAQLKKQLGELITTELSSYNAPVAVYTATFTNAPLNLSLSLNKVNKINGLLLRPKAQPVVTIAAAAPTDPTLDESPITLKTLTGTIHGTLAIPKNTHGKIPVVLIVPGSGPIDRDGNSPQLNISANTYKLLAIDLCKKGIASVRYDKRRVGESASNEKEADLRFDDYVDDVVGLVQILNDDQRFSKVIILGHSEGSLVGMLALRDQPVKGFVSVSGTGEQADKLVTDQMKSKPSYISEGFKRILDSLKKGKFTDNVDPGLYFVARPSIQHYLMSWFKYVPIKAIKLVRVPTLIVQGSNDLETTVADAEKLKKAKSDATLIIIPGMNHVLKDAPTDKEQNLATYNKPDLPLKPELVAAITSFIEKIN